MLRLLAPAADRRLLSLNEMKELAAGASLSDEDLKAMCLQVSDMIARFCNVTAAGAAVPTLRQETLEERFFCGGEPCALARRFVELVSVTLGDVAVSAETIDVDYSAGIIRPLAPCGSWRGGLVVTYKAGFAELPGDLQFAARAAVREFLSAAERDPLLRGETIDGVGRFDYQIGGSAREGASALPVAAQAALSAFWRPSL